MTGSSAPYILGHNCHAAWGCQRHSCARSPSTVTSALSHDDAAWMTARALMGVRGGSLRRARAFIAAAEREGWCRVREVKSRRGRPTKLLHRGDYDDLIHGRLPACAA